MALTEEEEVEELRLMEASVPREGLAAFIARISPHHPAPPHLAHVIARIERAVYEPIRLCISMPPRHAKTHLIQHAIAWWLANVSSADTCAYSSYNHQQATSKSSVTRDLAEMGGVQLDPAMSNLSEWRTMDGGGLLSGGAGSGLTGQGVSGLMVVDDPLKDREEANSKIIRDQRWSWFTDVVMTRLEGASVIVIHTRWHPDDMIGRIQKEMPEFEIVNLPALAEEDDPLGREFGAALWPSQYDETYLKKLRKTVGAFTFDSLYQGRPRPRGATVFGPAHYYDPKLVNFTGCKIGIGADPAASEKTSADYSAAVAGRFMGIEDERKLYLTEVLREQVQVPQFVSDLRAMQARNNDASAAVEGAGIGKTVVQTLEAVDPHIRVHGSPTRGDKFARAQGVAAAWNSGRVLIPLTDPHDLDSREQPEWVKDFLDEVAEFTGVNDEHDDQVDAMAHLWNAGAFYSMFDVV